jgi:CHAT domain-containing protein
MTLAEEPDIDRRPGHRADGAAVSAFQLAGYAQVVGTLREVEEAGAASVTAQFYRELAATMRVDLPLTGALALHTMTRRMRDEFTTMPGRWAAHLHSGV